MKQKIIRLLLLSVFFILLMTEPLEVHATSPESDIPSYTGEQYLVWPNNDQEAYTFNFESPETGDYRFCYYYNSSIPTFKISGTTVTELASAKDKLGYVTDEMQDMGVKYRVLTVTLEKGTYEFEVSLPEDTSLFALTLTSPVDGQDESASIYFSQGQFKGLVLHKITDEKYGDAFADIVTTSSSDIANYNDIPQESAKETSALKLVSLIVVGAILIVGVLMVFVSLKKKKKEEIRAEESRKETYTVNRQSEEEEKAQLEGYLDEIMEEYGEIEKPEDMPTQTLNDYAESFEEEAVQPTVSKISEESIVNEVQEQPTNNYETEHTFTKNGDINMKVLGTPGEGVAFYDEQIPENTDNLVYAKTGVGMDWELKSQMAQSQTQMLEPTIAASEEMAPQKVPSMLQENSYIRNSQENIPVQKKPSFFGNTNDSDESNSIVFGRTGVGMSWDLKNQLLQRQTQMSETVLTTPKEMVPQKVPSFFA